METAENSRVHLVFKTHLDVGFTDLAANVVKKYFTEYIPAALNTADALRESGSGDRFIWTTGAWLLYEYLEQATASERRRVEGAIAAGDLTWHAMPFTLHCELMDPSLFRFGLGLSQALDRRFGHKTIAGKMTDVPGHTRGIVPLLAEAGVEFLHIGVNEASTVPDVPPVFVWRDPSGAQIVVMYHHSYGSTMIVPNLADSISFAHTIDNRGPQDAEEVHRIFAGLRAEFPHATVVASTLNDFAKALRKMRDTLPVVTSEIGDTWIHGAASDPRKMAQYRALSRLRVRWITDNTIDQTDERFAAFSRSLLLIPEHTWGLDDKTFLAEYKDYRQDLSPGHQRSQTIAAMEASWEEQRRYINEAVDSLGETAAASQAREALSAIKPKRPLLDDMKRVDPASFTFVTSAFTGSFDPESGAISNLTDNRTERELADATHVLGLFRFQTFSHHDYDRFLAQYVSGSLDWASPDFGKPGLEGADPEARWFEPNVFGMWVREDTRREDTRREDRRGRTVVIQLRLPEQAHEGCGGPKDVFVTVFAPREASELHFDVQWFDKPPSRLPQACWFAFSPVQGPHATWQIDKLGSTISPLDVVRNGNRKLHGVLDKVICNDGAHSLAIHTLDAPLVAPGDPSLLNFGNEPPLLQRGMHFNLYNNTWGTNFPSWCGGAARFRFVLRIDVK